MDNADSVNFFKNTLRIYKNLFNIENVDIISVDKHPGYFTKKYGMEILRKTKSDIRLTEVQHHKAHAAAVIAENNLYGKEIIAFCWDGTGYGDDKKIWGSEIFFIDKKMNFKRIGHIREKILPGGEITITKPYRMALTYLYYVWKEYFQKDDSFYDYIKKNFKHFDFVKKEECKLLVFQIEKEFSSIYTTSMGRFFDAVSSLLNLKHYSTYEGEAAVSLEMNIDKENDDKYDINKLILTDNINKVFTIDDIRLFSYIADDFINGMSTGSISVKFHNTLASIILEIGIMISYFYKTDIIVLSGGVFQNNYLFKKCFDILKRNDFKVFTNFQVPINDGGISLGQAFISLKKTNNLI
jgi:hydrogenase maturation protein HypF